MKFSVLTLFPDQVLDFLGTSIIGRAMDRGVVDIEAINIRDFADNPHKKVDDTLYGGGTGMLMQCEPVFRAWESVCSSQEGSAHLLTPSVSKSISVPSPSSSPESESEPISVPAPPKRPHTIFLSPKGKVLDQQKAQYLLNHEHIVLLCGHYEGIDQRVLDEIVDEEISIGDYVLTGGEVAACVVIDVISRMVKGVLPDEEAFENETHMQGMLEAPQYTKPSVWQGKEVPEVLLSGHHKNIEEWRRLEGLYLTYKNRPDMLEKLSLTSDEWMYILQRDRGELS